ncbi:Alpha/Beta hydrolase protein [Multifurca ochricompacta]|uniref:Alpha/Beta hydrolase protein n=1 Tax=Multifurca ochricompacta TaxID=376703 RepID=A0AAD4QNZ0_9AGAM|nr:Alpha/Beta hydrolase protein [Multifurca ochricompacta]
MPTLSQTTGLKLAPLYVQTLLRHYYGKVVKDPTPLASLYATKSFCMTKFFILSRYVQLMQDATAHTVEEFQDFTKARALSPPWASSTRTLIPLSSCDAAASHLIKAFGGEQVMKQTVGGTKWWQVRSDQGVEAEWITAEKRQHKSQRHGKGSEHKLTSVRPASSDDSSEDDEESSADRHGTDNMPCLLYVHGGGYYFGSADGGRGSLERYAQKIRGRVFAVDYRLAPQYPFPCAIQDVLAAYLYLIQPPVGASHHPINPSNIVIAGDSSGGGLALALLQVIRDADLPLPAGGVLVSPWCDLTHSFHSITTNTDTDVLPATGLSLHKPSLLWPPPSADMTSQVHTRTRMVANDVMHSQGCERTASSSSQAPKTEPVDDRTHPQFQFYVENRLLRHPLVSPALGYLGGLPPLFFIAGNGEVLRDEIVYTAHRAAHPEKFSVSDDVKMFYPTLEKAKDKMRSTPVHLQIYDDAAHILPNLFPFTTPGKFCIRAIATFVKQVTGSPSKTKTLLMPSLTQASTSSDDSSLDAHHHKSSSASGCVGPFPDTLPIKGQERLRPESKRQIVASLSQAAVRFRGRGANIFRFGSEENYLVADVSLRSSSLDGGRSSIELATKEGVYAGDRTVYNNTWSAEHNKGMIRERVSTQGVVRPLEDESKLPAFQLASSDVGVIQESVLRRYLAAKEQADQKFASTIKSIEKQRARNVERASRELAQRASALRDVLRHGVGCCHYNNSDGGGGDGDGDGDDGMEKSHHRYRWRLAWALDPEERPPPSSIVGRLDTEEASRLARAADQGLLLLLGALTIGAGNGGRVTGSSSSSGSGSGSGSTLTGLGGSLRSGAAAIMAAFFAVKLQWSSSSSGDGRVGVPSSVLSSNGGIMLGLTMVDSTTTNVREVHVTC